MNAYFMFSADVQCSDLRVQQAQDMREYAFSQRQESLRRKLKQASVDNQKVITKASKEIASSGGGSPRANRRRAR